jgi:hypothetical protein
VTAWGPETLSVRDKVCFLPDVAARLGSTLLGLAAYRLGKRGPSLSPNMDPPPTAWATTAESHSRDVLWPEFYDHSLRTWCFGLALAQADGVVLDKELFYVAAMLHDIGLRKPIADRCFTYAGAEAAESTAPPRTPRAGIEQVKTAILAHIDIRVPKNPLGHYLQAGSLLDLAGTRITAVDPRILSEACTKWSRANFSETCRSLWLQECRRFPHGRAAYARRPGCLLLATHLNPLR